eukprot:GABV01009080.1.p1 GENE.GABV01009080.1~~GABV01009080.1.p1  ORF type:complete len:115 (+),score=32.61 GABV01009080.1:3-347(+)
MKHARVAPWEEGVSIAVFVLTLAMLGLNLSDVLPALYGCKTIRKTEKSILIVRLTLMAGLTIVAALAWDWGGLREVMSIELFEMLDELARAFVCYDFLLFLLLNSQKIGLCWRL